MEGEVTTGGTRVLQSNLYDALCTSLSSSFSLLSVVYLLDSAGRLIGVNRRCMDAVVITYLADGFPHVSYSTDLSSYFTPHAGLGYDMNNIRINCSNYS